MKIKIILPVLFIIVFVSFCSAQSASSGKHQKSVFIEGGGNGIGVSGNFEIRLKPDRNDGLGASAGAGIFGPYLSLPLNVNYIAGKKQGGFESGIGLTSLFNFNPDYENSLGIFELGNFPKFIFVGLLNMGYRHQAKNGLMLRANLSALYYHNSLHLALPGLAIGYSFK